MRCIVPYCRRSRGQRKGEPPIVPGEEWICGNHWRAVSLAAKAVKRKAAREARRHEIFWKLPPGSPARLSSLAARDALVGAWERCKTEAIEAAVGLR